MLAMMLAMKGYRIFVVHPEAIASRVSPPECRQQVTPAAESSVRAGGLAGRCADPDDRPTPWESEETGA